MARLFEKNYGSETQFNMKNYVKQDQYNKYCAQLFEKLSL